MLIRIHSDVSGQQAIHFGCQAIASGDMDLVIAGGIEVCFFLSRILYKLELYNNLLLISNRILDLR